MKTKIMIPAMLAFALAVSPMMANSNEIQTNAFDTEIVADEKTKLDVENLPEVLKNAIANDATAAALTVKEAWHIEEEGKVHYKVTFDMGGENFIRKYDAQGNLIEDSNR